VDDVAGKKSPSKGGKASKGKSAGRAKPYTECSDLELLRLFDKSGDHGAFEALVQRHRRQVYNFIIKMVGKAEAAEDLFQETFLRVLKNAHTYTPRAKFTTWCLQIARNLALDYFKREGLRRHASIDAGSPGNEDRNMASLLEGDAPQSIDILQSQELIDEVREAVQVLPANQREALVLRIYHDMPYAEISEVLGSPEGTVKYWVHEAVNTVARHLERRGLK
jgi:RNA polymerase sigma-70 factor, ECF subfamily